MTLWASATKIVRFCGRVPATAARYAAASWSRNEPQLTKKRSWVMKRISPRGPREGLATANALQRRSTGTTNLILLCRVDHKKVDDQPHHYTTARLRQSKAEHEAWVEHALGKTPLPIRFQLDKTQLNRGIDVDLPGRIFSVKSDGTSQRFKIPDGYDIRISDMKQIIETASIAIEVQADHWWKLYHDRAAERDRFTTTKFSLTYAGEIDFGGCYIEWMCDAEGYDRGYGYRGDGVEDTLGGIITDQPMDGLSYSLANNEEYAVEEGYSLDGNWYLRILKDVDTDALVQARISARWSKPLRWTATPIGD
jgi:hypothetical protein